jgi:hypothetical protein
LKKNTKALSPIFATLIILAVVTVLFIPVFIWATGTTSQTQDSWQLSGLIATERIVIEEVNLKADAASCTIYVRNIGKTAVSVDNVFISLSYGTGTLHVYSKSGPSPTFTTSPNSVIQGDLITVTFTTLDFTPATNEAYTVKVSTARGVSDTYQVVT